MTAATIVAHGTEAHYVRRAAARVMEAIRQLPPGDDCWVGLYWGNGAPVAEVATVLDWAQIPAHVVGLVFVGSVVAFPQRDINNFCIAIERGWKPGDPERAESSVDESLARAVRKRTEVSAGVRATLIKGTIRGKRRQLLRRDGSERIPPFNLILDRDPPDLPQGRA